MAVPCFDATLLHLLPFSQVEFRVSQEVIMGQVHVRILLTNYREAVLARLGQFDATHVHRYETEALIDTGATRSVLPPAIAEQLGLLRLGRTEAKYADGRVEEVDVSEAFFVEILGRNAVTTAMILGEQIRVVPQ